MGNNSQTSIAIKAALAVALVPALTFGIFASLGCAKQNGPVVVPAQSQSTTSVDKGVSSVQASSESEAANSANEGSASSSQDALPDASPVVYEEGNVRISIPAEFAEKGYKASFTEETASIVDQNGSIIAGAVWGSAASHQDERKAEFFWIGPVLYNNTSENMGLRVFYLDDKGASIYLGAPDAATAGTIATAAMGLAPEDLISWFELDNGDGFVPAQQVDNQSNAKAEDGTHASEATPDYFSPLREPFWGVWTGASKDYDEACAMAETLIASGFNGMVFVTTDWSNLNTEPWYVVTAGFALEESAAERLCAKAHANGYPDAYIKYSGDYQG